MGARFAITQFRNNLISTIPSLVSLHNSGTIQISINNSDQLHKKSSKLNNAKRCKC